MRFATIMAVLMVLAGTLASCTDAPATPAQAVGEKASAVVMSGGKAVLRIPLPAGAKTYDKDEMLTVVRPGGPHNNFYVWTVKNAQTLEEALPRVGEVIKGEFTDFKPAPAKDLTVAGAPAKQLNGPGKEADDGDPGVAEVIVFSAGGHVFAACLHGEEAAPAALREFMMTAIQAARVP